MQHYHNYESRLMNDALTKGFSLLLVFLLSVTLAQAQTFYVDPTGSDANNGSQSNPWATVQHAVNNVSSGDTVQLNSGTYTEQVTIDQDLTIVGNDSANTVIQSPANLDTSYIYSGKVRRSIVNVDTGNTVNFHKLKIDGNDHNDKNQEFQGLSYLEASGLINKCAFVNMQPFSGQDGVPVIGIASDGTSRSVDVTNSNMRKFTKNGAAFFGGDLSVTFHNNTILGYGPTTGTGQNGVQVQSVSYASIQNNTIKNISHDDADVVGILAIFASDVDVKNNDLDEVKNPIFLYNTPGTVNGNDIDLSPSGIGTIDNVQGIYFWNTSGTNSATADNNNLKVNNGPLNSSSTGIYTLVQGGDFTINGTGNTIKKFGTGIFNHITSGTLTATFNSTTFNNNNTKVDGIGNPTIKGSLVSDAISATQAGGNVNFPAGNINESLTISKNLTITADGNPSIQDLTIDGSGINVTLNDALEISNSLSLTNGIVNIPNSNDSITITDDASISGASSSSYINGKVSKVGNQSFTFPVGDGGRLAEIDISAPSNSTDAFTAVFNNEFYSDTTNFIGDTLNNVSRTEYWELDRTNGSSAVDVTLHWEDGSSSASDITNLSDLVVAHWNGSAWESFGQSGQMGNTTSGSITANGVNNFSPFTFGSKSSSENPLPVELVHFKGQKKQNGVKLNWQTASEKNASHFIVQRSKNGKTFENIDKVRAQGTTAQPTDYNTLDEDPKATNYYRLKQVDFDGSYEYSKVISVAFEAQQRGDIQLFNDGSGTIEGQVGIDRTGRYQISVRNSSGQVIHSEVKAWEAGNQPFQLNLNEASKGVYFMEIVGHEQQFQQKFSIR